MPSTTCTSLALAALLAAAPALAETAWPEGCFARDYDAEHLAAHPGQVVQQLRIAFYPDPADYPPTIEVIARMAHQGHAAEDGFGGMIVTQVASCWDNDGAPYCGVDCDGGTLQIGALEGDTLTVSTRFFRMGSEADEGCGGSTTLSEGDGETPTTYRLTRAAPETCLMTRTLMGY